MKIDILLAVDGTGSKEWRVDGARNSAVHNFYSDFAGEPNKTKGYFDGPEDSGMNVWNIHNNAMRWLADIMTDHLKAKARITVIGHSRGGVIAVNLAKTIGRDFDLPVYFLGLYDAVDFALGMEAETIDNVENTAHAVRNPDFGSRSTWGNAARPKVNGKHPAGYQEKLFMTSHGGIGGDVEEKVDIWNPIQDRTCVDVPWRPNVSEGCNLQSQEADKWLRGIAKGLGLPI